MQNSFHIFKDYNKFKRILRKFTRIQNNLSNFQMIVKDFKGFMIF